MRTRENPFGDREIRSEIKFRKGAPVFTWEMLS